MPKYSRILLKLSGEFFAEKSDSGIGLQRVDKLLVVLKQLIATKLEIGLVIGGGNLVRGIPLAQRGFDRETGDYMGMLATVINGLALQQRCQEAELPVLLVSLIKIPELVAPYDIRQSQQALAAGKLVIFAGGTGKPWCTTDSAAADRAVDIEADILLKATTIDGVYSADPKRDSNAQYYSHVSYDRVIEEQLAVMDQRAFECCRQHKMPIRVFDMAQQQALQDIVAGKQVGTLIDEQGE